MNKNDRVKVDFTSESSTEFSGNRFTGEGVVDRVEDGRVFGRLDNGTPFMCDESDAVVIDLKDSRDDYEAFFMGQPFYLQMKYIHGDRLFDFDQGIGYRNLTVQIGYVCWCKDDKEFVI